jgi:N-glycosylase/DNA lyase
VFVPFAELDVDLCASSGQVFRFHKTNDGWIGVDGSEVVTATRVQGGWEVSESGREFFQLQISLCDIERRILERSGELAKRLGRFPGLRVLKQKHAHETLFSFLCTPNNNLNRIIPMVRHLGSYGNQIGDGLYEFPSVERIAVIPESELRKAGFGYRARTIPNVARQVLAKPNGWLISLREKPYKEAHSSLCELDGIGPKVADCVCLVGLWHTEAVPVDTHLWQAACDLYFPDWKGKSITQNRYDAVGNLMRERFGELAGWAHQYLFYERILDYRKGKPVYSNP